MFVFTSDSLDSERKRILSYVYEKYGRRMFSAAKRIVNNDSDAEDALHNAFVKVAKRLDKIDKDDHDALCGYLLTVVKNEAVNIIRKRKNTVPLDEAAELPCKCDVVFETERREIYEYAAKIMTEMDETYRAPLYLHVVTGYSEAETARLLNRKLTTVRVQISRAKKILSDKLKEAGYEL